MSLSRIGPLGITPGLLQSQGSTAERFLSLTSKRRIILFSVIVSRICYNIKPPFSIRNANATLKFIVRPIVSGNIADLPAFYKYQVNNESHVSSQVLALFFLFCSFLVTRTFRAHTLKQSNNESTHEKKNSGKSLVTRLVCQNSASCLSRRQHKRSSTYSSGVPSLRQFLLWLAGRSICTLPELTC